MTGSVSERHPSVEQVVLRQHAAKQIMEAIESKGKEARTREKESKAWAS